MSQFLSLLGLDDYDIIAGLAWPLQIATGGYILAYPTTSAPLIIAASGYLFEI